MKLFVLPIGALFFALAPAADAIILYGLDNNGNTSDPATGVPWASVGSMSNGTGIYLGDGYVLTAAHVSSYASITFGSTTYNWDNGAATTIDTADLRVFRLSSIPTIGAVQLYTGTFELTNSATIIGTGLGRNPETAINTALVPWGDAATRAQRWGTNQPTSFSNVNVNSYTSNTINTILGSGAGANEAGLTLYDSGGAMFQKIGGVWYLTGVAAYVSGSTSHSSTFGNEPPGLGSSGDTNSFIRISNYASQINSTMVPEPSAMALSLLAVFFLLRRKR